jgi:diguanylate cyclase (GGDEF)-like protein
MGLTASWLLAQVIARDADRMAMDRDCESAPPATGDAPIDWAAIVGEGTPDATVVLDQDFQVVWRSRSTGLLTGIDDGRSGGEAASTNVHPGDLTAFLEAFGCTKEFGCCSPVTFRLQAPDERWLECNGWIGDLSAVRADHTFIRFRIAGVDGVGDRGSSVDPFLALTDASRLGYALVSERGVLGYRNPVFAGWFPERSAPTLGSLAECVRPADRASFRSWADRTLAGEDATVTVVIDSTPTACWLELEAATRSSAFPGVSTGITAHDVTRLHHEATHDHLSGLLNRAAVIEALDRALEDARADGSTVGTLFCDLDNFKLVNDGLGHEVGDQLLCRIARRISDAVRAEDIVGRLGGDEFLVVTRNVTDAKQLVGLAERIASSVAEDLRGTQFPVSLSIGAAVAEQGCSTAGALVREADAAMYRAKSSGKARTELFRDEMRDSSGQRLEVGSLLRTALDDGRITVHYQPVFHQRGGRWKLRALEALARCPLPDGTNLSPNDFVPVAEQTGLISRLGHAVRDVVAADLARWSTRHGDSFAVWVNVSVQELDHEHLLERMLSRMNEQGLSNGRIGVEVTESALASNHPGAIETISALRDVGMQVIVDDFGTGYSSLGALKDYPADVIKIDRRFIAGVLDAPADLAIVRAVTEIGRVTGIEIVAEGVECEDQLSALVDVGCCTVQGFHLARPMPASLVDQHIGAWINGDRTATAATATTARAG